MTPREIEEEAARIERMLVVAASRLGLKTEAEIETLRAQALRQVARVRELANGRNIDLEISEDGLSLEYFDRVPERKWCMRQSAIEILANIDPDTNS